jgi:hypothetical protein
MPHACMHRWWWWVIGKVVAFIIIAVHHVQREKNIITRNWVTGSCDRVVVRCRRDYVYRKEAVVF